MCALEINISSRKSPVLINGVSMFKLIIEEYFERDWPLFKAQFTSLDETKAVNFFVTPGNFVEIRG